MSKVVNIRVDETLWNQFQDTANQRCTTASAVLRDAMTAYVEQTAKQPGVTRAYLVDECDLLTITSIAVIDGRPVNGCGEYLACDGKTRELRGWPDSLVDSYENGRVLVPVPT